MAYIGNRPEQGNFRKCDAITTSATATYNLLVGGVAVNPNQLQCIVSLNAIIQSPGTSYTIANSQITFASALTSSDVIDFILILGDTLDVGVPSDDTVDASKITANVITGQTALGATPADTDELLISDAGTLKRVDYSYLKSSVVNRPNAKPLIINGDMAVAQRGTSTSGITGSNNFVVDRFRFDEGADATLTMSQETLTSGGAFDDGFKKSLKLLVTTNDGSLASNQSEQLMQSIEAQDLQLLKFGTSNAVNLTLAFWYKSNVTGTHVVTLDKEDSTRTTCPVEFTVSVADTWEYKVCNFNSDATIKASTGAIANDNGTGLRVMWNLAYGSDYTSGTNGDWTQNGVSDFSTSNQQNIVATNSNYVELTGVQLEVGTYTSATLPPFQHESYAENLRRCQRYYYLHAEGTPVSMGVGNSTTTSDGQLPINFPTAMRTLATIEVVSGTNYYKAWRNNGTDEYDGLGAGNGGSVNQIMLGSFSNFSTTVGTSFWTRTNNANAKVAFSAEL